MENPSNIWVRKEGAIEGIVPLEFFLTAQETTTARSARLSDEELLDHLKRLYADAGHAIIFALSGCSLPFSAYIRAAFGSSTD